MAVSTNANIYQRFQQRNLMKATFFQRGRGGGVTLLTTFKVTFNQLKRLQMMSLLKFKQWLMTLKHLRDGRERLSHLGVWITDNGGGEEKIIDA